MCRMAAYLGPSIFLEQFLLEPPHSLANQAHSPRELRYAKINADGFGFGWYTEDGIPAVYLNPFPIWSDPNLEDLGHTLVSDMWLAYVRSATPGLATGYANTQPFKDDTLLFMHNGFIREFDIAVRPILHRYLDASVQARIRGNTDSEYLFGLLRQMLATNEELGITEAIATLYELLQDWLGERPAMLNFIVSNGQKLYASRHASNETSPSLYYTTDDESFPGAQLIASEPLTNSEYWRTVPEHSILVLDPDLPPELLPL